MTLKELMAAMRESDNRQTLNAYCSEANVRRILDALQIADDALIEALKEIILLRAQLSTLTHEFKMLQAGAIRQQEQLAAAKELAEHVEDLRAPVECEVCYSENLTDEDSCKELLDHIRLLASDYLDVWHSKDEAK